jgi:8-oxo-dGTP pyrophosphatase MutT (NUDIX family)
VNGADLDSLRKRVLQGGVTSQQKEDLPVAAVAIIINPKDRGGSLLLIKRTEREADPWSGQIAFPGGRKSPLDQDFLHTAMREAEEEVGIDLRKHRLIGHLPIVYPRTHRVQVVPYVFELTSDPIVRTNEEVSESFWASLNALEEIAPTKADVDVDGGTLKVDAYTYDGHVIWGLTFRVINVLLERH